MYKRLKNTSIAHSEITSTLWNKFFEKISDIVSSLRYESDTLVIVDIELDHIITELYQKSEEKQLFCYHIEAIYNNFIKINRLKECCGAFLKFLLENIKDGESLDMLPWIEKLQAKDLDDEKIELIFSTMNIEMSCSIFKKYHQNLILMSKLFSLPIFINNLLKHIIQFTKEEKQTFIDFICYFNCTLYSDTELYTLASLIVEFPYHIKFMSYYIRMLSPDRVENQPPTYLVMLVYINIIFKKLNEASQNRRSELAISHYLTEAKEKDIIQKNFLFFVEKAFSLHEFTQFAPTDVFEILRTLIKENVDETIDNFYEDFISFFIDKIMEYFYTQSSTRVQSLKLFRYLFQDFIDIEHQNINIFHKYLFFIISNIQSILFYTKISADLLNECINCKYKDEIISIGSDSQPASNQWLFYIACIHFTTMSPSLLSDMENASEILLLNKFSVSEFQTLISINNSLNPLETREQLIAIMIKILLNAIVRCESSCPLFFDVFLSFYKGKVLTTISDNKDKYAMIEM